MRCRFQAFIFGVSALSVLLPSSARKLDIVYPRVSLVLVSATMDSAFGSIESGLVVWNVYGMLRCLVYRKLEKVLF